ncbi:Copper chaperone CopZ [Flexibacter flexilis DSM 6793]|uniref:Copper chaperone CopZ n=1 Tax=Flexibacter flexilis DSM 6793 TaxID=927664 RepID=A0A1I1NQS6_9BACT|nr:heavy-metal-associated domain-containing protein [Flexibacter flexilis]SFC97113.1 Copper chaperone CopZ [Flexibacter flexilis DSM 6793]
MKTLQFKTNIRCGGCVATVTPALDQTAAISKWSVDTNSPDKRLTVEGEVSADEVKTLLEKVGYKAEVISE